MHGVPVAARRFRFATAVRIREPRVLAQAGCGAPGGVRGRVQGGAHQSHLRRGALERGEPLQDGGGRRLGAGQAGASVQGRLVVGAPAAACGRAGVPFPTPLPLSHLASQDYDELVRLEEEARQAGRGLHTKVSGAAEASVRNPKVRRGPVVWVWAGVGSSTGGFGELAAGSSVGAARALGSHDPPPLPSHFVVRRR